MRLLQAGLVVTAVAASTLSLAGGQSSEEKREAIYQAALQSYSEIVKPGMTRKDVEALLKSRNTPFGQICCVEEGTTFSDLTKIGKEKHPWYCEAHNVHVAIEFVAVESRSSRAIQETDVVKKLTIWHHLEGCL
jgi:hypothetical protein